MRDRTRARLAAAAWLSVAGVTVLAGCGTGAPAAGAAATTSSPPDVLGPDGYGPVKLGMSKEQALATGLLGEPRKHLNCTAYTFKGHTDVATGGIVAINPKFGVVIIGAPDDVAVHTPEGIGIGSTEASTKTAYPELGEGFNGSMTTVVPGVPNASYRIAFDNGKVRALGLVSMSDPTCGAS